MRNLVRSRGPSREPLKCLFTNADGAYTDFWAHSDTDSSSTLLGFAAQMVEFLKSLAPLFQISFRISFRDHSCVSSTKIVATTLLHLIFNGFFRNL